MKYEVELILHKKLKFFGNGFFHHCARYSFDFHIKTLSMKVYICNKFTSSVDDVKCNNSIVSEFMNGVMIAMI